MFLIKMKWIRLQGYGPYHHLQVAEESKHGVFGALKADGSLRNRVTLIRRALPSVLADRWGDRLHCDLCPAACVLRGIRVG